MSMTEYAKARKLAQKAYRQSIQEGKYPYLEVLDERLPFMKTAGESDLGLIEIPIDRIVGTKTAGRTKAFASNFMPLLDEYSEFAGKWNHLYEAHINEGIREPIIACEFYNSYYVIEGNKRVSVLKYSGAVSISGYVTRIIPERDDSKESKIYYEFMAFNRLTGVNTIYFSRPDGFYDLLRLMGKGPDEVWSEEDRKLFSYCFSFFSAAYRERGGEKLPITPGDAFLVYLNVYGYKELADKSRDAVKKELSTLWKDLEAIPEAANVSVIMQPEQEPEKNIIQKLISPVLSNPAVTVGFLYYKTAETSGWTYSHNLGCMYLKEAMADDINVRIYDGLTGEKDCMEAIERAIFDGCRVIFTTSPRFLGASIRSGMKYPDIKILNCSLNSYSGHLRTYYGRLYEAKFLVGMLAGILSSTDHIGYMADFPIYGTTANINAFALGVKVVNPTAWVHLAWSSQKGVSAKEIFKEAHVSHISGADTINPSRASRLYGLYDLDEKTGGLVASPIWHWGKFYQRILQTILNGNWSRSASAVMGSSINYWWGISSGMVDMITSSSVPRRTLRLVELVKKQIVNGEFQIFSGELRDQNGVVRHSGNDPMTPEEIIRMDWLCDNIKGTIPTADELVEDAVPMVEIQGIHPEEDSLSERKLT